jgi:uncharacterized ion transporter superfamily protein YfcC
LETDSLREKEHRKKLSLTSFSILYILQILLVLSSLLFAGSPIAEEIMMSKDSIAQVIPAKFSVFYMATFNGFKNAMDIAIFIFMLSGFINVVNETEALSSSLNSSLNKLKGRELYLLPILIIFFAIGGTTFGFGEETIPLYGILTAALLAAGFDTMVVLGVVLLGSGVGIVGSTINPFSTGVAMDSLKGIGIDTNAGIIFGLGGIVLFFTTIITIIYVMRYAKKVKSNMKFSILSESEYSHMNESIKIDNEKIKPLTKNQKITMYIFGFSFLVMFISLIPWQKFNINIFDNWSNILTGEPWGQWYFGDLAMWFLSIAILIGIICKLGEEKLIEAFMQGAKDVVPVVMIIVVSRGTSVLMSETNLDMFILDRASHLLQGVSPVIFVLGSYIIFFFLSILIPSSSGLAYVSMPIMGGLGHNVGISPELMVIIYVSAHGIAHLTCPTSGVLMASIEINKISYGTWLKFVKKPVILLISISLIILLSANFIL